LVTKGLLIVEDFFIDANTYQEGKEGVGSVDGRDSVYEERL